MGGGFFGIAADFANQNYRVRAGVVVEKAHRVQERSADDGVAADADASGLTDAEARQLIDGLVSERAAAADDADMALFVNAARHDADFAFAGRDDAGAVGADEAGFVEVYCGGSTHHVDYGDAFRDADDERNFGVRGFEDGVGCVGWRNENDGGVRASRFNGFLNRVEYWTL